MKTYIGVTSHTTPEGVITPLSINWADGTVYEIDKVLSIRPVYDRTEYEVAISGLKRVICLGDDGRWFVGI